MNEASHWSEPRFQSPVIAFDVVVGVLISVVERVGDQFFDDGLERLGEIGDDLVGFAVRIERPAEKVRTAPMLRRGETKTSMTAASSLAVLVDGPVDVPPLPGDLHVGLVDKRPLTDRASAGSCGVDQQGE